MLVNFRGLFSDVGTDVNECAYLDQIFFARRNNPSVGVPSARRNTGVHTGLCQDESGKLSKDSAIQRANFFAFGITLLPSVSGVKLL